MEFLDYNISENVDKTNPIEYFKKGIIEYKIETSIDFAELIENLSKYCYDIIDEELIWKENEEGNNSK